MGFEEGGKLNAYIQYTMFTQNIVKDNFRHIDSDLIHLCF